MGAILETLGIACSIGGSLAGSFAGEPRATLDIDMVIELDDAGVIPLVRALEGEFYIDDQALRRAVYERSSANAIHQATSVKIDFNAGLRGRGRNLRSTRVRVVALSSQPLEQRVYDELADVVA